MKEQEDQRYLIALRNGDAAVIRELYVKFTPQMKRWVYDNSGTVEDAKDIFQEVLETLCNKAHDPDFKLQNPIGGYLLGICKYKWIDRLRKKRRMKEVRKLEKERLEEEDTSQIQEIERIEEEALRQKKLKVTFSQLSPLCQRLLRLVSEGISTAEIAKQLEMTNANTVYRRKNACIDRCRKLYQDLNS